MNKLNELINKLPASCSFIVDDFENVTLVGVYVRSVSPMLKKKTFDKSEKAVHKTSIDCLTEFFKKLQDGYYGEMFN